MKLLRLVYIITIIALLTSCSQKRDVNDEQEDTPEAFQDKDIVRDVSSWKRGYGNLVDELYAEIKEKNKELQDLETKIEDLRNDHYDDTKGINKYLANNRNFYTDALSYTSFIKDSVFRQDIFSVVKNSELKYNEQTENLRSLTEKLKQKEQELTDHYSALKIVLALEKMEQYQINDMPDSTNVKKLIERFSDLIENVKTKHNK